MGAGAHPRNRRWSEQLPLVRKAAISRHGCCSSRHQFLPSAESATKFIAGGVLGPLRTLHCRCFRAAGERPKTSPPAWRLSNSMNGGGVLANWGCYDLDYLLGLTGWSLRPRLVLAQTWKVPPQFEAHVAPGSDAETHFAAFVLCEGGTVGFWKIMNEHGEEGRIQRIPSSMSTGRARNTSPPMRSRKGRASKSPQIWMELSVEACGVLFAAHKPRP